MPDPAPPPAPVEPPPDDRHRAAAEAALLSERRRLAGVAEDAPTVGLALSGGGVRSATFCFGLLRGLAQRGQLPRIDYLSTVSGGGYIGAMFGRLVQMVGIARAQALLAATDSPVLAWLRRNGRYLTPSGSRDIGVAVVTYLRAFLAIHGEFIAVSLPFALLVILPHLLHTVSILGGGVDGAASAQAWRPWHTLWWPIGACIYALGAPGLMTGYWVARDSADPGERHPPMPWRDKAFVVLLGVIVVVIWLIARPPLPGVTEPMRASALALLALSSAAFGLAWAYHRLQRTAKTRSLAVALLRNRFTFALRIVTLAAAACVALGALDLLSWWLLLEIQAPGSWVWGGIGLGGAVVLVLRTLAQPLLALSQRTQPGSVGTLGPKLLNAAGLFGVVALVSAWTVGVQWLVFAPEPLTGFEELAPGARAALLLLVAVVWLLLTAGNEGMANASSLHSFYRARLTRAYLAVGNPARRLAEPGTGGAAIYDVTTVVPGDDTGLAAYAPELHGGPIHLVNTCLNQTRDDASRLYNADRKGTLVTATRLGFELGADDWLPLKLPVDPGGGQPRIPGSDAGTLGRWVAVSGAAAAPGAGAYTSRGWALMLYFLGVRLGYWMRSPRDVVLSGWRGFLWRHAIKPVMLWSEGTATFFGAARPWWYLSDGGHFENTGVFALLKRRVDFIIAADCGADADYDFADLENLVRKARIDLGAEIEFYTREEASRLFTLAATDLTVLSPEDMGDTHSARGVLLARIRYRTLPGEAARSGTLLVIKPNLHDALDVDLLAYAQRHAGFPHESTADQSFDEAQWESYHRLGEDFGRQLHEPWLRQLPGWADRSARHPLTVAARLRGGPAAPAEPGPAPWWRRGAPATALSASIGLGASGTLLLSLWQLQETVDTNRENERKAVKELYEAVSKSFDGLNGTCPKLADHNATQMLLLHDVRDSPVLLPIERDGVKALLGRAVELCERPPDASPDCVAAAWRLQNGVCAVLAKPPVTDRTLNYWAPVPAGRGVSDLLASWRRRPAAPVPAAPPVAAVPPPVEAPAAPPTPVVPMTVPLPAPGPLPVPGQAPVAQAPSNMARAAQRNVPPIEPALAGAVASACRAEGGALQLYTQVYDEASRQVARPLRLALQQIPELKLQVAPIEDVVRSAALRGTRRPAPWPQPTFVLHNETERACAAALAPIVKRAWSTPGERGVEVWIRLLPPDQPRQPRVIELWLPPRDWPVGNVEFW